MEMKEEREDCEGRRGQDDIYEIESRSAPHPRKFGGEPSLGFGAACDGNLGRPLATFLGWAVERNNLVAMVAQVPLAYKWVARYLAGLVPERRPRPA